ncbi:hypothetical protein A2975_03100 [Candidatus Woesebacteria bacterium RIFCSPLOWO2_01_FULL_44_14]|uniref:CopG-like ribbon-helix-helix domain-containing protein n=1 Tax=Candidatus Woesebacteria bacterium RIFCSPLOWO2_01_FULL_44_14 TaxID=1802525 RepID=A0A1F8BWJ8_9BACT|nr:MAG: hypothetical protein A2975_03100 [Candidatus Woesebacteria bacterium RIFCSPLOWO2_01_FULL_44_14]
MIRTQVYLPEDLYQELRLLARREEQPAAKVIRDLLKNGLKKRVKSKKRNAGDLLLEIAKIGARGPKDLSVNHDKYLYG